jgi:hypothetical protein
VPLSCLYTIQSVRHTEQCDIALLTRKRLSMQTTDPRRVSHAAAPPIDVSQILVAIPKADELYRRMRMYFKEATIQQLDIVLPPLLRLTGNWIRPDGLLNIIQSALERLQEELDKDMRSLMRPYTLSILAAVIEDTRIYDAVVKLMKGTPPRLSGSA